MFDNIFNNFNIAYYPVDTSDLEAVEKTFNEHPNIKMIFVESPTNPLLSITDIRKVAEITHRHNALLVVDNTFLSPLFCKPLELGADIVVESATKYLAGHNDLLAGTVVTNDDELAKSIYFNLNSFGGMLSPMDSYILHRSIKSLGVRLEAVQDNAEHVYEFLKTADIEKV
jgi:cystathionine beta-lyase